MITREDIEKLATSLSKAVSYAQKYIDFPDDGTCNFDTPQIHLTGWSRDEIIKAFELAGVRCWTEEVRKSGAFVVDIIGCLSGQANQRTKMAEAIRDSLRHDGYYACVYYQMD